MVVTAHNIKQHARKIKRASEAELGKIKEEYEKVIGTVQGMSTPMLLVISLIGAFIILSFRSSLLDIIGLLVFAYPFYLFVQKDGHEKGFCEGYYELMTKEKEGGAQMSNRHTSHE